MPPSISKSVLLPLPLGPTTETKSPLGIWSVAPSSAFTTCPR